MKTVRVLLLAALSSALLTGCGENINLPSLMQDSPTPSAEQPEPSVTQVPAEPVVSADPTATPAPTAAPTKAPRMIGRKTTAAGSVRISNSTGMRFRQLFLQISGMDDWGRNLIPGEGSIHVSEQFTLYYPEAVAGNTYNMRLRDSDGMIYEIYNVNLTDMDTAVLRKDDEDVVYLSYMSLSTHNEQDTRNSSWNNNYWDDGSYDSSYDDSSYDDSSSWDYDSGSGDDWNVESGDYYYYDAESSLEDSGQWDYVSE